MLSLSISNVVDEDYIDQEDGPDAQEQVAGQVSYEEDAYTGNELDNQDYDEETKFDKMISMGHSEAQRKTIIQQS